MKTPKHAVTYLSAILVMFSADRGGAAVSKEARAELDTIGQAIEKSPRVRKEERGQEKGQENILAVLWVNCWTRRMPRQARIEYEVATYHVMCRGDRREAIFANDRDRSTFLATLAEAVAKTGWRLHGYVLMSNHYLS